MPARFLQIHALTSYPAVLLNRDDAGFAKRIPFGGSIRTRISSQCLKRHWRSFEGAGALSEIGLPMSVRSRVTFDRYVYTPLCADGVEAGIAAAITQELMVEVLGESAKAKAKKEEEGGALKTGQITVLGPPELEQLLAVARAACEEFTVKENANQKAIQTAAAKAIKAVLGRDGKKNIQALSKAASGLDAAMFGRMVTSDILARGDAALHVAHAFTVHAEESESDYFSAVDELLKGSETGSGHIGSVELTSGLYYSYVVIDVPLLVSNLEGCAQKDWLEADRAVAAEVASRMLRLIATVSPGAKRGSTAPYSYAQALIVEAGDQQPSTFANAFLRPVQARQEGLVEQTYAALQRHVTQRDQVYGAGAQRQVIGLGEIEALREALGGGAVRDLAGAAAWVAEQVQ